MCRPISYGGLGVLSPKFRALACLIRSFLETAANPKFRRNLYHDHLFRYHILNENDLPDPGFPPYYSPDFFSTIRRVKEESPLNVITMTIIQWTRLLVEDNLTTYSVHPGRPHHGVYPLQGWVGQPHHRLGPYLAACQVERSWTRSLLIPVETYTSSTTNQRKNPLTFSHHLPSLYSVQW